VRLLAADGKTIFISSHILSELEEICDSELFINEGQIVHHGSANSLKFDDEESVVYIVNVADAPDALASWADMTPGVTLVELTKKSGRVRFDSSSDEDVIKILGRLVRDGLPVVEFRREERRLEDAFIAKLERNGRES